MFLSLLLDNTAAEMTEDECMEMYFRLNTYTGVVGTPFDNYIEYEAFKVIQL